MFLPAWIFGHKVRPARTIHKTPCRYSSPRETTVKPRLERLEDRLALSSFGPEDGSYVEESWFGYYGSVEIQASTGNIVVAGADSAATPPSPPASTNYPAAVARYDSGGNTDTTFGASGVATVPKIVAPYAHVVLQSDGKAIVAGLGDSSTGGAMTVARFTTSGSLDTTFGSGGVATGHAPASIGDAIRAVGLQSTGKIVVAGTDGNSGGSSPALVGRFTASGQLDSGRRGFGTGSNPPGYVTSQFGPGTSQTDGVNALAVQSDDKIVIASSYTQYTGGVFTQYDVVARYTASGALDTTFNHTGYAILPFSGSHQAIAIQGDGKIVMTDGTSIARLNSNGTLDTHFGSGAGYEQIAVPGGAYQSVIDGVTLQPDGKIVVAGWETAAYRAPQNILVARFNADGTPDSLFGSGGYKLGAPPTDGNPHSFSGSAVALEGDGSIIVAGQDLVSGGVWHPLLMRFSGDSNPPAVTQSPSTTSSAAVNDSALLATLADDLLNPGKRKG